MLGKPHGCVIERIPSLGAECMTWESFEEEGPVPKGRMSTFERGIEHWLVRFQESQVVTRRLSMPLRAGPTWSGSAESIAALEPSSDVFFSASKM